MESWKKEIHSLNKIREDLNLNYSQLEKLTKVNRGRLKNIFEFKNIPSLKLFVEIKEVLEKEKNKNSNPNHKEFFISVPTPDAEKIIKRQNKKLTTQIKETFNTLKKEYDVKDDCDCYLDENGLLRRGKIKCTKSKSEHSF